MRPLSVDPDALWADLESLRWFGDLEAGFLDAKGQVVFRNLSPGEYRAALGLRAGPPLQIGPVVLHAGQEQVTNLELPPHGWIRGRLSPIQAGSAAALLVVARRPETFTGGWNTWLDRRLVPATGRVESNGEFLIGPIPPGPYGLEAWAVDHASPATLQRPFSYCFDARLASVDLESAVVLPGKTLERCFDFDGFEFGALNLSARVDGVLEQTAQAVLIPIGPHWSAERFPLTKKLQNDGSAQWTALPVGRYRCWLQGAQRSWISEPITVVVTAGTTPAPIAFDVQLLPGSLLLVAAGPGEPLANHEVRLVSPGLPEAFWPHFQTDPSGHLQLSAQPGRHWLTAPGHQPALLAWPPRGAPLELQREQPLEAR
jgi:hypothetical protein